MDGGTANLGFAPHRERCKKRTGKSACAARAILNWHQKRQDILAETYPSAKPSF
jgi:hypothetical protein